jgi:hypothetical protein
VDILRHLGRDSGSILAYLDELIKNDTYRQEYYKQMSKVFLSISRVFGGNGWVIEPYVLQRAKSF